MNKTLKIALVLLVFLVALPIIALTLTSSKINSVAWNPPPAPAMNGPYALNELLKQSELLGVGAVVGAEDVAVDQEGLVYGGTHDGKIVRIHADGRTEAWADTGGRPLGLHFDKRGNLIVADSYKGLLSIDPQANISVLSRSAEGQAFAFCDDLDIAADGKIYFTDASSKWTHSDYDMDLLETRPYGRLLVYDPDSQSTSVLARDLYFANGVALSHDEDFVLVNETWRYRVMRYWIKGPKQGELDVFIDNLPGFPAGISADNQGRLWLALATERKADLDAIHPYPWLKNLVTKLPEFLQPQAARFGFVLGLDQQGKVIANLQDPSGEHLYEITSVQEHGGYLYFGSLSNDRIGRLPISKAFPSQ